MGSKCGLTNKLQPIANPSFSSGWTNNFELWFVTSTSVFQSAAVVGWRNITAIPGQSPDVACHPKRQRLKNLMMDKLDLAKKYKAYFTAKSKPELVQIESAQFISICGKGDPSDKQFTDKIEALYSTAYTLKFAYKAKDKDFVVSKLEGLWWFDEKKFSNKTIVNASVEIPRSEWEYRLLIMLPDFITKQDLEQAKEIVIVKKGIQLVRELEYFIMAEGKSVQMLHVGPFSTEPETLQQIGAFIETNKLTRNGSHHEIYLSDFRKTEAGKLKTILREAVK